MQALAFATRCPIVFLHTKGSLQGFLVERNTQCVPNPWLAVSSPIGLCHSCPTPCQAPPGLLDRRRHCWCHRSVRSRRHAWHCQVTPPRHRHVGTTANAAVPHGFLHPLCTWFFAPSVMAFCTACDCIEVVVGATATHGNARMQVVARRRRCPLLARRPPTRPRTPATAHASPATQHSLPPATVLLASRGPKLSISWPQQRVSWHIHWRILHHTTLFASQITTTT